MKVAPVAAFKAGRHRVAPNSGTATGGNKPDKAVLSRDQLRVDRERWPRGDDAFAGARRAPAR